MGITQSRFKPLRLFSLGHLKDQMSGEQFQTLNDLKSLVERLIRAVTPEQCGDTIQHFCSKCGDVFREMVAILNSFYKVVQMENRYMFVYKILLLTFRMVLLYFCKSVLHYLSRSLILVIKDLVRSSNLVHPVYIHAQLQERSLCKCSIFLVLWFLAY